MILLEKRWDEVSIFLIVLYPEAGWLFNRAAMAIILALAASVRVVGQILFWH